MKRIGFGIHAVVFVLVMLLLAVINLLTGPPFWIAWVLFGWGIGLCAHWAVVR
ncbi:MAG: 2TM domain-containing protein [Pirellulales bacterium]